LASPVNFYAATLTLQEIQSISFVLIGIRNAITFTVFNNKSESISGTGEVLPPQLQFGQNNTQTGAGVGYSRQLTGFTSVAANASYSRTKSNESALVEARSNNAHFSAALNTRFSPKTVGSAGVSYSLFEPSGGSNAQSTDAVNLFATISHTF